jgi:hypothetical protein
MGMQQIILLVIIVIGGAAVIGSYIYGLNVQSGGADVLWGGIPNRTRTIYLVSMILSALGFFAFFYYILFRLVPAEVSVAGVIGFSLFYVVFLAILIPSAIWMPLTNVYVANPTMSTWAGIRVVLAIVGLASIVLVWALLSLQTKIPGVAYWLAVAGSAYFAFHTAVLDAIIWPALYK